MKVELNNIKIDINNVRLWKDINNANDIMIATKSSSGAITLQRNKKGYNIGKGISLYEFKKNYIDSYIAVETFN